MEKAQKFLDLKILENVFNLMNQVKVKELETKEFKVIMKDETPMILPSMGGVEQDENKMPSDEEILMDPFVGLGKE